MSFDIRLIQLMNLFHVTNKELANECNVDPSLVSRWRTGQRYPSGKYDQIQQIALFFLRHNKSLEQQQAIQEIISMQKLHYPLLEGQTALLSSWLADQRNYNQEANSEHIVASPQNITILKQKKEHDAQTLKVIARPHFPLSSQTKKEFHVFTGNSGKRKAALLFIQKAVSIDTPIDIYILSDELLHWWLEDAQFQIQWNSYLKLVVLKNHRLHIIHSVNRNKDELVKYMNLWLPMHLVGSVNSHYYPKYVDNPIKVTHMVIKNHMALESRSTFLTPKENICLLFEDKDTVDMIESLFLGRLVNCKPLIQVYKEHDHVQLLQLYLQTVKADFNVVSIRRFINSIFLPDSVFEKYCESWTYTKKSAYMEFIKQWKNSQYQAFTKRSFIDVFPMEVLNEIIKNQSYSHYDPLIFTNKVITLTKDEIILTLKDMLYTIARFTELHVYLSMNRYFNSPPSVSIEYRENHSAIFTSNHQKITPYIGLYTNEGNLLLAFGSYVGDLLAQIPSSFKQKSETTKQIETVLNKLES